MVRNIDNVVDASHDPHRVDEKRDAAWHGGPFVTRGTHDSVRRADRVVDVREQRKREPLFVGESLVCRGSVERCTENDGPQVVER